MPWEQRPALPADLDWGWAPGTTVTRISAYRRYDAAAREGSPETRRLWREYLLAISTEEALYEALGEWAATLPGTWAVTLPGGTPAPS